MMLYPNCGYFNEEKDDEYAPPYGQCEECYRFDICLNAKTLEESERMKDMKSSDILLSLDMEDLEVSSNNSGGVNVCYKGAKVKDGIFLTSAYGRGKDFEEACDDYLSQIRGKTLVFDVSW